MSNERSFRNVLKGLRPEDRFGAFALILAVLTAEMAFVASINLESTLAFVGYLGATAVVYRLLMGELRLEAIGLYAFYAFLMLVIYEVQLAEAPMYLGFSGKEGAFGTDDTYYFSQLAERVPHEMDLRIYYAEYANHPYVKFLDYISFYDVYHLMDIIWANLIPMVLLPVLTRALAFSLTGNENVARGAFLLMVICPFTLANSLILIRDGWTAMLFVGAIYFFYELKVGRMAVLTSLLFYLRVASGIQLVMVLGIVSLVFYFRAERTWVRRSILGGLVLTGAGVAYGSFYLLTVVTPIQTLSGVFDLLFREEFLGFFRKHTPDAFILQLYELPTYIRIPASFAFFFVIPILPVKELFWEDMFVIRGLMKCIYSLIFIFIFRYLVVGVYESMFSGRGRSPMILVVTSFLLLILALSQVSMQVRHKVMVMPLQYIIAAYGFYEGGSTGRLLGSIAMFLLIFTTILKFAAGI
jgi:hypothetical protein